MTQQAQDQNFLRRKAQEWATEVVALHNTAVPPEMEKEKQAMLARAKKIKMYIEKVLGEVPELSSMNQLGFLPLVVFGAATVATAGAYITKWSLDYAAYIKRINERRALIMDGMTPEAANALVNSEMDKPSWHSNLKTIGIIGAIVGAFYIYKRY